MESLYGEEFSGSAYTINHCDFNKMIAFVWMHSPLAQTWRVYESIYFIVFCFLRSKALFCFPFSVILMHLSNIGNTNVPGSSVLHVARSFLVVQCVKDLVLSLLCCRFDPWPGNLGVLWARPKKKNCMLKVYYTKPFPTLPLSLFTQYHFLNL